MKRVLQSKIYRCSSKQYSANLIWLKPGPMKQKVGLFKRPHCLVSLKEKKENKGKKSRIKEKKESRIDTLEKVVYDQLFSKLFHRPRFSLNPFVWCVLSWPTMYSIHDA